MDLTEKVDMLICLRVRIVVDIHHFFIKIVKFSKVSLYAR